MLGLTAVCCVSINRLADCAQSGLYLQIVQALFQAADEVLDLLILQGQGGGDLPKRFLRQCTYTNY